MLYFILFIAAVFILCVIVANNYLPDSFITLLKKLDRCKNVQKRKKLLKRIAESCSPETLNSLAYHISTEKSAEAFEETELLYRSSAQKGNTKAMIELARAYSELNNTSGSTDFRLGINLQKEYDLLTQAAQAGDTEAMCSLSNNYLSGNSYIIKNLESALAMAKLAAYSGSAEGYDQLGYIYQYFCSDFSQALENYEAGLRLSSCSSDKYKNLVYGAASIYESKMCKKIIDGYYQLTNIPNPLYNPRKAAYCTYLKYICDLADDFDASFAIKDLNALNYSISETEAVQWRSDAQNHRYNPPN